MKAYLLDIDYTTVKDRAEVKLYLRGEEGRLEVYDRNFLPYFYVLGDEVEEKLLEEGALKVEGRRKKLLGREVKALQVFASHPQEVPELRNKVKKIEGVDLTLEDDILFTRRYLIDRGMKPLTWYDFDVREEGGKYYLQGFKEIEGGSPGLRTVALDIEVYNPGGVPRPEEDPIIMVSLAGSGGLKKVLTWKDEGEVPGFVEVLSSEGEMLGRLEEIFKEEEIDVVVGYNTDNFDFPYIKKRLQTLDMELQLGGDNIKIKGRKSLPQAALGGLPHLDLYPIVRRNVRLNSYVLENVLKEVLKEEKEKIPNEKIWEYWDAGGEKLEKLFHYSLEDAEGTLRLSQRFVPLYVQLSAIVGQCLYDTSRMTTGQMVEWYLMRIASRASELIPNRPKGEELKGRFSTTYAGGYVHQPRKGMVRDIAVFDFRSLYPSIIVTHNIDPSTLREGVGCEENKAPSLDYCFSREEKGFIPSILEGLVNWRGEVKKKMEGKGGEELRTLDFTQKALKILSNSFYGYMGYPRARWYRRECAESVASFAREYIKKVMATAKEEFGLEVVYGDTDSLFVLLPGKEKARAEEFLEHVNRSMPGIIQLELEGFYLRGLFVSKKRYALLDEKGKITVKGLEFVRRDWAPIARETQQKVLEILLKEGDEGKALRLVREVIENIKRREVTLNQISIYTQLTRKVESYEGKEPHVGAAKKLQDEGYKVKAGSIIGYIVAKGRKGEKISERTLPVELASVEDYDPNYYIENQILPAVGRIFDALGYRRDYIKTGVEQRSLGKWIS